MPASLLHTVERVHDTSVLVKPSAATGGLLAWVERAGNALPDPVFIFVWLILGLIVASVAASLLKVTVAHPTQVDPSGAPVVVAVTSLLSSQNLQRLFTEMPQTFVQFTPLGYVMLVMLGAGVAERSGLVLSALRSIVRATSVKLLTPVVVFVGIMSHLASDAAYVVLIPMAGGLYAAAGRHPVVGIIAAFAAVSGGFSANLLPGQADAVLLGITEVAAKTLAPHFQVNVAGNWYFMIGMTVIFLPIIWWLTDNIIEPRLGPYRPQVAGDETDALAAEDAVSPQLQRKGLLAAALAVLGVAALWLLLVFGPGTPLVDDDAPVDTRFTPLYRSLAAAFFVLFLAAGCAYGVAARTIRNHRHVVRMTSEAMGDLRYYLVLAFTAAHFVAMFNWSNLGLVLAVGGANALRALALPVPLLMGALVLASSSVDLLVGSASAKWAFMAPVLVPMGMLLGVSPEMTTAAYRVGDSVTNVVSPLMVYFPLVLTFCQRWKKDFGFGSLTAAMLPYTLAMLAAGLLQTLLWVWLDLPLGPGADVTYPVHR